jgi:hypothetical protein
VTVAIEIDTRLPNDADDQLVRTVTDTHTKAETASRLRNRGRLKGSLYRRKGAHGYWRT